MDYGNSNPNLPPSNYAPTDIERKAIDIVKIEKQTWEDATAFVTEKVAFQMRNLIRQLRKNFWGVFNDPVDPTTGRRKIWVPLTESTVDTVVKNIDLDTKDINFAAKNPDAIGLTSVVRQIVKNELDKLDFGQYLDEFEKTLAIDGTAVWKTIEYKEDDEYCTKIIPVDLLNIYIDPTARSIQEAYRFTERGLLTRDEVLNMTGWLNRDKVVARYGLPRTDSIYRNSVAAPTGRGSKYVDVWETWGLIPRWIITGKTGKPDDNDEIEGHIIVSGLDTPGYEVVHLIEANQGKRPYEEAWYSRMPNRWYGKGVAEKLFFLQLWMNTIVNIRINRSYVSQLGLWKIKRGSGITPQMISKLSANGALVVQNMDDLEQLIQQEVSEASYKDEEIIYDWSQRVTSAFEVVTGEQLPSSTSATAIATQQQNAKSEFVLIREQVGMFLERWLTRHAIPIIMKNVDEDDVVMLTGDAQELRNFDELIVNAELKKQLDAANKAGRWVDPDQVLLEQRRALDVLEKSGHQRYVTLLKTIDFEDYAVKVYITNEDFDKGVMLQNLIQVLQTLPALPPGTVDPTDIIRSIIDLMGLDYVKVKAMPMQQMQQPGMNQNNAQQAVAPTTRPGGNPPIQVPSQLLGQLAGQANTTEGSGQRGPR